MEGLPQLALLVTLDLLKGWPVMRVSCHVPTAVVSFGANQGSLCIVATFTQRPIIKIMSLSRGGKHVGTTRKRFFWHGERSQSCRRELWSIVRPWQSSSQVDLLKQLRRCASRRSMDAWNARRPYWGEFFLFSLWHWNAWRKGGRGWFPWSPSHLQFTIDAIPGYTRTAWDRGSWAPNEWLQYGWSDALRKALEGARLDLGNVWRLPRQLGEECIEWGAQVLVATSREACARSLSQAPADRGPGST